MQFSDGIQVFENITIKDDTRKTVINVSDSWRHLSHVIVLLFGGFLSAELTVLRLIQRMHELAVCL